MFRKLVKIILVQADTDIQKMDGGTYKGAKLTYEDQGQINSKGIAAGFLERNLDLFEKIKKLEGQAGKEVVLEQERVEKGGKVYVNILDILPASAEIVSDSAPAFKPNPGNGGGGFKRESNGIEDKARIARGIAVQAAASVDITDQVCDVELKLEIAEAFAAFILAPLSVDSMGKPLSVDTNKVVPKEVVEVATKENVNEQTPF